MIHGRGHIGAGGYNPRPYDITEEQAAILAQRFGIDLRRGEAALREAKRMYHGVTRGRSYCINRSGLNLLIHFIKGELSWHTT